MSVEMRPPAGLSGPAREKFMALSDEQKRIYLHHWHRCGRPAAICLEIALADGKTPWGDDEYHWGADWVIDADCPGCGWPERNFDGRVFGCRKCDYTSRERNS